MRRTLLLMVSIGAWATAALPATAAHAAPAAWVTGPSLSADGHDVDDHDAAVLGDGTRVVAWSDFDVVANTRSVQVRVAPPGAAFGPAQKLSAVFGTRVKVSAGPNGAAAVTWLEPNAGRIAAAIRPPSGGPFATVTPLTLPAGVAVTALDATLAYAGAGQDALYVVSAVKGGGQAAVQAARVAAGATALTPVAGTGPGGTLEAGATTAGVGFEQPRIAAAGPTPTAAWVTTLAGSGASPQSTASVMASSFDGTGFSPATQQAYRAQPGTSAPFAALALTGGLVPRLAWAFGDDTKIQVTQSGSVATLPTRGGRVTGELVLAQGGDGSTTLGWTEYDPMTFAYRAQLRRVPITGAAGSIEPLGPATIDRRLSALAAGSDGDALALIRDEDNDDTLLVEAASAGPGGGAFGALEAVSGTRDGDDTDPLVALAGPGGREYALWLGWDAPDLNDREHLFLSERDVTPPEIARADGPATGTAGERLAFAAAATDDLTGTALAWDFGDGATADGDTATHAFATPGAHAVTLTATDGAGHAVRRTLMVAVAARPPEPPRTGGGGGSDTPAVDRTPPVLRGLTLSRARFRAAAKPTAVVATTAARAPARSAAGRAKATPSGTTIRVRSLSERATLAITFTRRVRGRARVEGTLVRAARGPGAIALAFSGRIGKAALPAGEYTMSVVAVDPAGNRSKAATAKLRVVAR